MRKYWKNTYDGNLIGIVFILLLFLRFSYKYANSVFRDLVLCWAEPRRIVCVAIGMGCLTVHPQSSSPYVPWSYLHRSSYKLSGVGNFVSGLRSLNCRWMWSGSELNQVTLEMRLSLRWINHTQLCSGVPSTLGWGRCMDGHRLWIVKQTMVVGGWFSIIVVSSLDSLAP